MSDITNDIKYIFGPPYSTDIIYITQFSKFLIDSNNNDKIINEILELIAVKILEIKELITKRYNNLNNKSQKVKEFFENKIAELEVIEKMNGVHLKNNTEKLTSNDKIIMKKYMNDEECENFVIGYEKIYQA